MLDLRSPEGPPPTIDPTRRGLAGIVGLVGYAAAVSPLNAAAITTPSDGLVTGMTSFPSQGFDLPAFVARPDVRGRRPVIIVVSEIFGLHEYIRDVCRRFARAGYVAVAPAFFARAGDPSTLTDFAQIRALVNTASNAQVMGDVDATIAWADAQPFANKARIGITGFCWGGAVTWMASAHTARIKAGVAWYGRLVVRPDQAAEQRRWPVDVAGELKSPVLGLYGEKDAGIPLATVEQMRAALAAAGNSRSRIIVYPGADHGFHADYRPQFNAAAATAGWAEALDWFRAAGLRARAV